MSKITNFQQNEKFLLQRTEEAYNNILDAGEEIELSIHNTLIDLVEIPPWNIPKIIITLMNLLISARRLRKLSIYHDSLREIGYTLGYIKGRKKRYEHNKKRNRIH